MKLYVEGEVGGEGHRVTADLEASDYTDAAVRFALKHPQVTTIHVWADFNASTESARRVPSPARPLATFHVNRDPGDEDSMRVHRVRDAS